MTELVEIKAVVRTAMLARVIHALREAGVPRLTVTRVHAIGAGVDPDAARLSVQEGTETADKALVQFVCAGDACHSLTERICQVARSGRQGDGIVYVTPVLGVTKIRTGLAGVAALA